MENSVPQANPAGARLATTGPTSGDRRIDIIDDRGGNILQLSLELHNRLQSLVDRLDGSRPNKGEEACEVDPPGTLGRIDQKQQNTIATLQAALAWTSELEGLV